MAESVLYTWIYNNTNPSILAAILFHFVGNSFGQLFAISARAEVLSALLSVTAVLFVLLIWRPQKLTRRTDDPNLALR